MPVNLSVSGSTPPARSHRAIDVAIASVLAIVALPVVLALAALVKLDSAGPAFFRQERVGLAGRTFRIIKLRTMESAPERGGPGIAATRSMRVTRVGRVLRRLKVDEIPQLFNVLRGEMSLVGPRPELPAHVTPGAPGWRRILSVPPGCIDSASLLFCDEERLLAQSADPERAYASVLLPLKMKLALADLDQGGYATRMFRVAVRLPLVASTRLRERTRLRRMLRARLCGLARRQGDG